jgi:hypothetical protein
MSVLDFVKILIISKTETRYTFQFCIWICPYCSHIRWSSRYSHSLGNGWRILWSDLRSYQLYSRKGTPVTHWVEGQGCLTAIFMWLRRVKFHVRNHKMNLCVIYKESFWSICWMKGTVPDPFWMQLEQEIFQLLLECHQEISIHVVSFGLQSSLSRERLPSVYLR